MRLLNMFFCDLRFQFRHGFYYAYFFITVLYIVLLRLLPADFKQGVAVAVIFSDASVLGFFFIGGIVLMERQQNMFESLFVTPLRLTEYLSSKILSLSLLALLVSSLIIFAGYGVPPHPHFFFLGVASGSIFAILTGLLIGTRVRHLNAYFLLSMTYTPFFLLPLLDYFNLLKTPLSWIFPPFASILLISYGFQEPQPFKIAYALIFQILCSIGLFIWAKKWFRQYVITQAGDNS